MNNIKFIHRRLRSLLLTPELGVASAILILTAVFATIEPALISPRSLATQLRAVAFVGMIAVGETMLMIAGELDLSVGSVAGLCAIVTAWLTHQPGWTASAAVACGILTGVGVGLINGLLAVKARIPAFIVTLGMLYMARGANYLISAGYPIYPLPRALTSIGKATPLGLSWGVLVFLAVATLGRFTLVRTTFGRAVHATGGNAEAARIAGIHVDFVKICCFVLTSALAAIAGILLTAQLGVGLSEFGVGWELEVVAAVVIGGVSLFGGVGGVSGTVLGLFLMQIARNGLVFSGANTHWQTVAVGAIMIAAVGLDIIRRRTKYE